MTVQTNRGYHGALWGKRAMDEYFNTYLLYGGEMMKRGHIIQDLRANAPTENAVNMYLFGLDAAMERYIGRHCDIQTGEEKS